MDSKVVMHVITIILAIHLSAELAGQTDGTKIGCHLAALSGAQW